MTAPLYWAGPDGLEPGREVTIPDTLVWVTTERRYARWVASLGDRGTVYRVTPAAGEVVTVQQADDVWPTWLVQGLFVDAVVDRRVKMGRKDLAKFGERTARHAGRHFPRPDDVRRAAQRIEAGRHAGRHFPRPDDVRRAAQRIEAGPGGVALAAARAALARAQAGNPVA